eukprot:12984226-Alexandrium_andersonii.AAC.1
MYACDTVVAPAGPPADPPPPVGGVALPGDAVVRNMERLEALLAPPAVGHQGSAAPGPLPHDQPAAPPASRPLPAQGPAPP